jgi:hypothetical protein
VKLAQGEAGDGGVLAFAIDGGDEAACDGGDERVLGAAGQGGDFLLGWGDGDVVDEFQSEQAGVPGFEDPVEAGGCGDAERAIQREEQQVLIGLRDAFVEELGKGLEPGVIGKAEGDFLPMETGGSDFFDSWQLPSSDRDGEDVAGIVRVTFRETVGFVGAAVPGSGRNLAGAVPVAEREVVEFFDRQSRKVEPIGDGQCVVVLVRRGGSESLDGAVGENDAREVGWKIGRDFTDPGGGIAGFVAPEKRGGEDDGIHENDGFGREQDAEVGGKLLLFAIEKLLFPDGAGASVVVVAGDDEDGHAERADGGTGGGNGGTVSLGGVEQVAGDEDECGVRAADDLAESTDGIEPLLADAVAFRLIADGCEGLAELPVRGVEEGEGHDDLTGEGDSGEVGNVGQCRIGRACWPASFSFSRADGVAKLAAREISRISKAMPPPNKGYKIINHYDVQYRWIMQNRRGTNELVIEAGAPVNGQQLIGVLPRVVNQEMVIWAIDFGLANGWKPEDSGKPFRCIYLRKGFVLDDGRAEA